MCELKYIVAHMFAAAINIAINPCILQAAQGIAHETKEGTILVCTGGMSIDKTLSTQWHSLMMVAITCKDSAVL